MAVRTDLLRPSFQMGMARTQSESQLIRHWDELVLGFPFFAGPGIPQDIKKQIKGTLAGNVGFGVTEYGPSMNFPGATGDHISLGDTALVDFGAGDWAVESLNSFDPAQGSQHIIGKDLSGARQLIVNFDDGGNNEITVGYFKNSNVIVYLAGSTNAITDTSIHHIVAQRSGSSFEIYIDGILSSSGTTSGTHGTMQSTTTDLRIGARAFVGFTGDLTGDMLMCNVYSRSLSAIEVQQKSTDPFGMYRLARVDVAREFIAAAGGGRTMGALAGHGGLAGPGGIAGKRGGIAA